MTDRTTKALLLAIALGLWTQVAQTWLRATPVQAQGLTLTESLKFTEIASDVKAINAHTAAMRETLNRIWVSGPRP